MHRLQDDYSYHVMRDLSCADPQIDPSSGVRGDSHFSVCSGSLRLLFSIGGGFVESLEDPYPIPCCISPERENPNLRSTYCRYDLLAQKLNNCCCASSHQAEQLSVILHTSPMQACFTPITSVVLCVFASLLLLAVACTTRTLESYCRTAAVPPGTSYRVTTSSCYFHCWVYSATSFGMPLHCSNSAVV